MSVMTPELFIVPETGPVRVIPVAAVSVLERVMLPVFADNATVPEPAFPIVIGFDVEMLPAFNENELMDAGEVPIVRTLESCVSMI